ncbi:MAG: recombinase family protein [Oscillospiraceae bacterium]|nr:recombinase family protein [Oscillospiraceae bacterium]
MKNAAAYIRVSTEDQTEFSPDSQLKEIRKYAKAHDLILPDEFVFADEGISGRRSDKRPQFQRMIGTAKLKPKPFDVILLWKFSRFARNREDSIVYKSMLRKQCGIEVVSISEQLSEDKTSILIEALIEAMDEYYSLNLAEEVKRGMSEKFSRGGVVSQPPFGYRMQDGIFFPDETAAPIVQMIFQDYLADTPVRAIANKLNGMGITTRHGNAWENRTVEYVLTNPVYIGKLRRSQTGDRSDRFHEQDECVDGQHQPIIEQAVFDAAQAKRADVKKMYKKYARHDQPVQFMLKGLVRCDTCGATLVMSSTGQYLQCHNYGRGKCKVSHAINVRKLNQIVLDQIREDLTAPDFASRIQKQNVPKSAESPIPALIEKEERKLDRIREAYEAGIDTLDEYRQNKQRITETLTALREQLTEAAPEPVDIGAFIGKVQSSMKTLTDPCASEIIKNLTLHTIIEQIIFMKPSGRIEIVYHL